MTSTLLLIGAPGAGKSSILQALSSDLERRQIPHATLESEQFSMGWPLLESTTWIPLLATVLSTQLAAGRTLFLIAATPESSSDLAALQAAIPTSHQATICLSAPPPLIASRLDDREPSTWPGKQRLIDHATALAKTIPTFPGITKTVSTDGATATEIADHLAHDHLNLT